MAWPGLCYLNIPYLAALVLCYVTARVNCNFAPIVFVFPAAALVEKVEDSAVFCSVVTFISLSSTQR